MTVQDTDNRLAQLEAEHARLKDEVTRLRAANLEMEGWRRSQDHPDGEANGGTMSRSRFLRMGGAAAAGAVAATASGLLSAKPAGALTGQSLVVGAVNKPTTADGTTFLLDPSTIQLSPALLAVGNVSAGGPPLPAARIAVLGTTVGPDNPSLSKVGVWGQSDTQLYSNAGVVGRYGATGTDPAFLGGGVVGASEDNGTGVRGQCNGPRGIGVYGDSDAGYGVFGGSRTGIALSAYGSGRLWQSPRDTAGPPTSGTFQSGEQIRDATGELWLCVASGTPGTWRRAAAVKDGFQGGSVNMLAKPIRIFDSRSGAPLASGASVDVQVTGVVVGGISVPVGAVALLGNVAVTSTVGPSGYLTLYPEASPPSPATANINWFGTDQNLNTSVVVSLNVATGKLTIHNGIAGGSAPTHVILDAAAFVI